MNNDLHNDFSAGSVNWRSALRANNHRTMFVIFMFFAIYVIVGLLIDTAIYLNSITPDSPYPARTVTDILYDLVTLQLFPTATLIMLCVAAVSLFITYTFADQLMLIGTDYTEITAANARTLQEKQLYNIIEELKIAGGLTYMPKVYIINADYMNAFASGFSERSAMVAITRGLMEKLDRDELQAVMAHEISHIRHLDIKLTLTASLLANMTLIALDIAVFSRTSQRRNENNRGNGLIALLLVLRYLLPLINILLLLYLSRSREFMADAGCVELTRTNEPLARALIKISGDYQRHKDDYEPVPHDAIRREAYIFDPAQAGIASFTSLNDLFSTHPSLDQRLEALGYKRKNIKNN